MSLEEALRANTVALEANTAAHLKLAEVAVAAATGKSSAGSTKPAPTETTESEESEETAAQKKKRLAAEKAAAAKKAAAAEPPELETSVTGDEIKKIAGAFLASDDEKVRDANKANFISALSHLGAKKLGDVETDEDRARLAGYIAYWTAGLKVDFEAIDEIVAVEEEEEENLLG